MTTHTDTLMPKPETEEGHRQNVSEPLPASDLGTWHCVWKATFGHNSMLVSAPGRNPGNVVERMPELVASARAAHGPAASVRWDGLEFLGAICVPSV